MGIRSRLRDALKDLATRQRDIDALYKVLYDRVHDLDHALEIRSTKAAFGRQWAELPEGEYLLSDPWFRENVTRILTEQELLLEPGWFAEKRVLDAGCGNGRWSYGLARLGADLTSLDANDSALEATKRALAGLGNPQRFVKSTLEGLDEAVEPGYFDLVFCWGVAHHTVEFNRVLDNLCSAVAPRGVLYLYLYGSAGIRMSDEMRVFRDRVAYNVLLDDDARERFLLKRAHGDRDKLHSMHDIYAPLINRRFGIDEVRRMLAERGFVDCVQTMRHTEVFVRATRGDVDLTAYSLSPQPGPYWFEGRRL